MKRNVKSWLALLLALVMTLSLVACGSTNDADGSQNANQTNQTQQEQAESPETPVEPAEGDYDGKLVSDGMMPVEYSDNFTIELFKGGYRMINAGTGGYQYLVVPEGMSVPEGLGENVKVLQQPIDKVYNASTGMMSLIDAIGALDHIELVGTDVDGWYLDNVIAEMEAGNITFSGKYSEPDFEIITAHDIQLHVDTIMIDSKPEVLEKFSELGIPSLVENSSRESHPLARVEWVKLFGVLFDKEEEANQYFEEQKAMVESASANDVSDKTVALGSMSASGGESTVRNGGDYIAQMIGLAGGTYVLKDLNPEKTGTTSMTAEDWYLQFKDAEYFIHLFSSGTFQSVQDLIDANPLFADFRAVKEGKVWITAPDFTQATSDIASIIVDINTILSSENPSEVVTDHLIKLS